MKRLIRDSRELKTSISDLPFSNVFIFHPGVSGYFLPVHEMGHETSQPQTFIKQHITGNVTVSENTLG